MRKTGRPHGGDRDDECFLRRGHQRHARAGHDGPAGRAGLPVTPARAQGQGGEEHQQHFMDEIAAVENHRRRDGGEEVLEFHRSHGKLATMTSVRSPARFGRISFEGDRVTEFFEKPQAGEGWINGGFFILNAKSLDYIDGDETIWERDPIERLAHEGHMMGFRHDGFWSCMDTLKEKQYLEGLWQSGKAPWKMW